MDYGLIELMRLDRIYFPNISEKSTQIDDKEIFHKLKNVLRKTPGSEVLMFDGRGREYKAVITSLQNKRIKLDNLTITSHEKEKLPKITLAFSLVKSLKVDLIFRMCTEVGIDEFIPFISLYSIISLKENKFEKKIEHYQKIIENSCEQSSRLYVPVVREVLTIKDICSRIKNYDLSYFGSYNKHSPSNRKDLNNILIIIGPEGGFTEDETNSFLSQKVLPLKASENILRAETACVAVSTLVSHLHRK